MNEELGPDWVDSRAAFNATIALQRLGSEIKRDVASANRHALGPNERIFLFEDRDTRLTVKLAARENSVGFEEPLVTIDRVNDRELCARKSDGDGTLDPEKLFTVRLEWNSDRAEWEMLVKGQSLSPWEISQKALGPFFFAY